MTASGSPALTRLAVTAMVLVAAIGVAVPESASAEPSDDGTVWIDPELIAAVEAAASEASPVRIEIVTNDTGPARQAIRELGGAITGSVEGELVQATLSAGNVDEVTTPNSAIMRLPRRINRPVAGLGRTELGPLTGEHVAITNAGAWHAAGLRGGVKVGIVDFFDLGLWNPAEHGPRPDEGHLFCRDTSGQSPNYCPMPEDGINDGDGEEHGIAVVEVLKDAAPDAEVYLATVATTADLRAAIDWFASNGVSIISRSLGAPYDGPGDGTGPLAALVDYAAGLGITWFNSAGNDGAGGYGRYTNGVTADGYVDFDNGPGVDTTLTITGMCIGFDGIRWNDWGKPAANVTDYRVEVSAPGVGAFSVPQANQVAGAPPLEMVDQYLCTLAGQIDLRLRRVAIGLDPAPDVIEVAVFSGRIESGRSQVAFSAAKSVVDSRNPALVSVGAVDPPTSGTVASYSSQGPTNDGRVKPDVAGPSCLTSSIYRPSTYGAGACFNGTSASSPVAAGLAAILLGRGLARPGAPLASLVKHLALDLGPPGPDNATGLGLVRLPAVPGVVDTRPAQYAPLAVPRRILDTRAISPTPGAKLGPFAPYSIVDLTVGDAAGGAPVSAVAVNITSVDSTSAGYVQALPTLMGQLGGFANLNVAAPGQIKPNMAIVPVGEAGAISVFLPAGGNVVVDLLGTFSPAPAGAVAGGRFVPVEPRRVLDTRPEYGGPTPADPAWTPHRPAAGETVHVGSLPAGASAVVLNVTATDAAGPGFLRAQPTGATGVTTASGNYVAGASSGTLSIVPIVQDPGGNSTVSIFTSNSTHIVADLVGYFTDALADAGTSGLFVPIAPSRGYDSRFGPGVHAVGEARAVALTGTGRPVPPSALAVSANLAADAGTAEGFATVFPAGAIRPGISNLNFPATSPISNAALPRLSPGGVVDVFVNRATHVIIDVNGYFTGPA